MSVLKNAVPKRYRVYYIEPGIADYSDMDIGNVLVQKPALEKINQTYIGKPVVNFEHTDKEPEELFNLSEEEISEFADGVIAATGYDEESGWFWMDIMVWDQETMDNLDDGYSASCAYDVTEVDDSGGTSHGVPYEEEVLDGSGLHLAIVPNPRYENVRILQNSKPGGQTVKIKFLKKKKVENAAPPEPEKKPEEEETVENAGGAVVELENGDQVPIEELMNMYEEKKKGEMDNSPTVYNMDDEVEVDGKKMTVKELMSACGYGDSMENAEPAFEEDAEPVVKDQNLKNSKEDKEKKQVNKNLKNAAGRDASVPEPNVNIQSKRLDKGKARYGTPVSQGGK